MFAATAAPGDVPGVVAPTVPGNTTPTPGATMTPGPIPGVDTYATAALTAQTAYKKALDQINGNRQSTLRQFGYTANVDPNTGTLTGMTVDPNNPYGDYQTMLNTHAANQQQVEAAGVARGLGHGGGLAAQAITADHKAFGSDSAQLGESLMSQLEGFQSQQGDAQNTMNDALYQAQLQAAQLAILNGQFDTPGAPAADGTTPGADATDLGGTPLGPKTPAKTPAKATISAAQKALAERSAALNKKYGLSKKILPNAYNTNKNKRG